MRGRLGSVAESDADFKSVEDEVDASYTRRSGSGFEHPPPSFTGYAKSPPGAARSLSASGSMGLNSPTLPAPGGVVYGSAKGPPSVARQQSASPPARQYSKGRVNPLRQLSPTLPPAAAPAGTFGGGGAGSSSPLGPLTGVKSPPTAAFEGAGGGVSPRVGLARPPSGRLGGSVKGPPSRGGDSTAFNLPVTQTQSMRQAGTAAAGAGGSDVGGSFHKPPSRVQSSASFFSATPSAGAPAAGVFPSHKSASSLPIAGRPKGPPQPPSRQASSYAADVAQQPQHLHPTSAASQGSSAMSGRHPPHHALPDMAARTHTSAGGSAAPSRVSAASDFQQQSHSPQPSTLRPPSSTSTGAGVGAPLEMQLENTAVRTQATSSAGVASNASVSLPQPQHSTAGRSDTAHRVPPDPVLQDRAVRSLPPPSVQTPSPALSVAAPAPPPSELPPKAVPTQLSVTQTQAPAVVAAAPSSPGADHRPPLTNEVERLASTAQSAPWPLQQPASSVASSPREAPQPPSQPQVHPRPLESVVLAEQQQPISQAAATPAAAAAATAPASTATTIPSSKTPNTFASTPTKSGGRTKRLRSASQLKTLEEGWVLKEPQQTSPTALRRGRSMRSHRTATPTNSGGAAPRRHSQSDARGITPQRPVKSPTEVQGSAEGDSLSMPGTASFGAGSAAGASNTSNPRLSPTSRRTGSAGAPRRQLFGEALKSPGRLLFEQEKRERQGAEEQAAKKKDFRKQLSLAEREKAQKWVAKWKAATVATTAGEAVAANTSTAAAAAAAAVPSTPAGDGEAPHVLIQPHVDPWRPPYAGREPSPPPVPGHVQARTVSPKRSLPATRTHSTASRDRVNTTQERMRNDPRKKPDSPAFKQWLAAKEERELDKARRAALRKKHRQMQRKQREEAEEEERAQQQLRLLRLPASHPHQTPVQDVLATGHLHGAQEDEGRFMAPEVPSDTEGDLDAEGDTWSAADSPHAGVGSPLSYGDNGAEQPASPVFDDAYADEAQIDVATSRGAAPLCLSRQGSALSFAEPQSRTHTPPSRGVSRHSSRLSRASQAPASSHGRGGGSSKMGSDASSMRHPDPQQPYRRLSAAAPQAMDVDAGAGSHVDEAPAPGDAMSGDDTQPFRAAASYASGPISEGAAGTGIPLDGTGMGTVLTAVPIESTVGKRTAHTMDRSVQEDSMDKQRHGVQRVQSIADALSSVAASSDHEASSYVSGADAAGVVLLPQSQGGYSHGRYSAPLSADPFARSGETSASSAYASGVPSPASGFRPTQLPGSDPPHHSTAAPTSRTTDPSQAPSSSSAAAAGFEGGPALSGPLLSYLDDASAAAMHNRPPQYDAAGTPVGSNSGNLPHSLAERRESGMSDSTASKSAAPYGDSEGLPHSLSRASSAAISAHMASADGFGEPTTRTASYASQSMPSASGRQSPPVVVQPASMSAPASQHGGVASDGTQPFATPDDPVCIAPTSSLMPVTHSLTHSFRSYNAFSTQGSRRAPDGAAADYPLPPTARGGAEESNLNLGFEPVTSRPCSAVDPELHDSHTTTGSAVPGAAGVVAVGDAGVASCGDDVFDAARVSASRTASSPTSVGLQESHGAPVGRTSTGRPRLAAADAELCGDVFDPQFVNPQSQLSHSQQSLPHRPPSAPTSVRSQFSAFPPSSPTPMQVSKATSSSVPSPTRTGPAPPCTPQEPVRSPGGPGGGALHGSFGPAVITVQGPSPPASHPAAAAAAQQRGSPPLPPLVDDRDALAHGGVSPGTGPGGSPALYHPRGQAQAHASLTHYSSTTGHSEPGAGSGVGPGMSTSARDSTHSHVGHGHGAGPAGTDSRRTSSAYGRRGSFGQPQPPSWGPGVGPGSASTPPWGAARPPINDSFATTRPSAAASGTGEVEWTGGLSVLHTRDHPSGYPQSQPLSQPSLHGSTVRREPPPPHQSNTDGSPMPPLLRAAGPGAESFAVGTPDGHGHSHHQQQQQQQPSSAAMYSASQPTTESQAWAPVAKDQPHQSQLEWAASVVKPTSHPQHDSTPKEPSPPPLVPDSDGEGQGGGGGGGVSTLGVHGPPASLATHPSYVGDGGGSACGSDHEAKRLSSYYTQNSYSHHSISNSNNNSAGDGMHMHHHHDHLGVGGGGMGAREASPNASGVDPLDIPLSPFTHSTAAPDHSDLDTAGSPKVGLVSTPLPALEPMDPAAAGSHLQSWVGVGGYGGGLEQSHPQQPATAATSRNSHISSHNSSRASPPPPAGGQVSPPPPPLEAIPWEMPPTATVAASPTDAWRRLRQPREHIREGHHPPLPPPATHYSAQPRGASAPDQPLEPMAVVFEGDASAQVPSDTVDAEAEVDVDVSPDAASLSMSDDALSSRRLSPRRRHYRHISPVLGARAAGGTLALPRPSQDRGMQQPEYAHAHVLGHGHPTDSDGRDTTSSPRSPPQRGAGAAYTFVVPPGEGGEPVDPSSGSTYDATPQNTMMSYATAQDETSQEVTSGGASGGRGLDDAVKYQVLQSQQAAHELQVQNERLAQELAAQRREMEEQRAAFEDRLSRMARAQAHEEDGGGAAPLLQQQQQLFAEQMAAMQRQHERQIEELRGEQARMQQQQQPLPSQQSPGLPRRSSMHAVRTDTGSVRTTGTGSGTGSWVTHPSWEDQPHPQPSRPGHTFDSDSVDFSERARGQGAAGGGPLQQQQEPTISAVGMPRGGVPDDLPPLEPTDEPHPHQHFPAATRVDTVSEATTAASVHTAQQPAYAAAEPARYAPLGMRGGAGGDRVPARERRTRGGKVDGGDGRQPPAAAGHIQTHTHALPPGNEHERELRRMLGEHQRIIDAETDPHRRVAVAERLRLQREQMWQRAGGVRAAQPQPQRGSSGRFDAPSLPQAGSVTPSAVGSHTPSGMDTTLPAGAFPSTHVPQSREREAPAGPRSGSGRSEDDPSTARAPPAAVKRRATTRPISDFKLRLLFISADADGDGCLTPEEAFMALAEAGWPEPDEAEANAALEAVDAQQRGMLTLPQFQRLVHMMYGGAAVGSGGGGSIRARGAPGPRPTLEHRRASPTRRTLPGY